MSASTWWTRRVLRRALVLLAMTAAAATPAAAQVRLHGRVVSETTGEPIAGARVELTNIHGARQATRITDEEGMFSFFVNRSRSVRLRAEHLGFKETLTPRLYFDQYNYYQVEIRLHTDVVLLAPLEVVARTSSLSSPVLSGFELRRTRSVGGVFFTRADIEQRKLAYITDLLITVPGVQVSSSGRGARRFVVMGRGSGRGCVAAVYVDGFWMNRSDSDFSIDDVVAPQAVHGIEVYRGASSVPADFLNREATCGVIVIWTRRNA